MGVRTGIDGVEKLRKLRKCGIKLVNFLPVSQSPTVKALEHENRVNNSSFDLKTCKSVIF